MSGPLQLDAYQTTNWTEALTDVTWIQCVSSSQDFCSPNTSCPSSNIPALQALLLNPSFADSPLLPLFSAIHPTALPGCLTNYLLRPTDHLRASIDELLPPDASGKATTVSVQIRLGNAVLEGDDVAATEAEGWKWHEEALDSRSELEI